MGRLVWIQRRQRLERLLEGRVESGEQHALHAQECKSILLLWIGVQLLTDEDGEEGHSSHSGSLMSAVRTILIADLVMSLDNVLAVASAAEQAPEAAKIPLLIIGLALSIPLIIAGSTLLIKVMDKYPIIITLGAALLGYLAGSMIVTDPAVASWFKANVPSAEMLAGGLGAVLVVLVAKWISGRAKAE